MTLCCLVVQLKWFKRLGMLLLFSSIGTSVVQVCNSVVTCFAYYAIISFITSVLEAIIFLLLVVLYRLLDDKTYIFQPDCFNA